MALSRCLSRALPKSFSFKYFSNLVKEEAEKKAADLADEQKVRKMVIDNQYHVSPVQRIDPCFRALEDSTHFIDEDMVPLSGVQKYVEGKTAVIMKSYQTSETSGFAATYHWEMTFPQGNAWKDPLMGWASSDAPMESMVLQFDSWDSAIRFAKQNGYNYQLVKETEANRENKPEEVSAYSHNFLSKGLERQLAKKGGKRVGKREFRHEKGGASHYCKPLKYHGDGKVAQHGGESKMD